MRVDIHHLRLVVTVAETGSITAAATRLGVSQPALSAQIARIEQALGCAVFVRSRQGVALTSAGEMVVERSRSILDSVDQLVTDAAEFEHGMRPLRVGANRSPFFASLLVELEYLLPDRRITPIVDASSSVITEHLISGELDLVIVGVHSEFEQPLPAPLQEIEFIEYEPFLVAIAEDSAPPSRPLTVSDLANIAWLLPPGRPDGTDEALNNLFAAEGIKLRAPYGRQGLSDYWPYVAAGNAVALALPTYEPPIGVRVLPLAGNPIVGRRVVRWHPDRVDRSEAVACARSAAAVYEAHVAAAASRYSWWNQLSDHHPRPARDLWN